MFVNLHKYQIVKRSKYVCPYVFMNAYGKRFPDRKNIVIGFKFCKNLKNSCKKVNIEDGLSRSKDLLIIENKLRMPLLSRFYAHHLQIATKTTINASTEVQLTILTFIICR